MSIGVILYGPPAAGKDTVTEALLTLDPRFERFERLKAGRGSQVGYRMVDAQRLDELTATGDLIWANRRYGSTYAIDRPRLMEQLASATPVIHLGQPEAISAIQQYTAGVRWIVVGLWCPREEAAKRLTQRGADDHAERLAAWDATPTLPPPASTINTAQHGPDAIARLLRDAAESA